MSKQFFMLSILQKRKKYMNKLVLCSFTVALLKSVTWID